MNGTNGNGSGSHASVAGARPVVLVRYRPGVAGESARTVHLVTLPLDAGAGAVSALCGALLRPDEVETVTPGEGMPCSLCALSRVAVSVPPAETTPDTAPATDTTSADAGPLAAETAYRAWGWPVTVRREQVWLSLDDDTVALLIPVLLAAKVASILSQRRCPPLVLTHPYAPEHRVLLAGEPYGLILPWPPGVHRITGTLLLPPTVTPRGPLTWVYPPQPNALRLCREIDVLGALRTALIDPPAFRHDPTRDGDVHPDTPKLLDPKDFEKSGQTPTDDDD